MKTKKSNRGWPVKHFVAFLVFMCAAGIALAQENQIDTGEFYVPPGDATDGRLAFVEVGCAQCHRVQGDADLESTAIIGMAPVLGFTIGTPRSKIMQAIISPSHTIAEGFGKDTPEEPQVSPMIDLSDRMTLRQLRDIIAYLELTAQTES